MPKIVSCHCNLPCKKLRSASGTEFLKCEDKKGCNYFMNLEEAKELNRKRDIVKKNFDSFAEFPHCRHHLKVKLRVAGKKAKNPGRVYFCCNVQAPDNQCEFFHWADEVYEGQDDINIAKRYAARAS